MRQTYHNVVRWIGNREPAVLLSLLIIVGGLWVFVILADEVRERDTQAFDEWAVQALRRADDPAQPVGPRWMVEVARDLTSLGGWAVLILTTFAVAGYLWLSRRHDVALFFLAATVGGVLLAFAMKELIGRPRPEVSHLTYVDSESFPSGHAMMATVVYLTLGALVTTLIEERRRRTYILLVALVVALLVGLSRVYLGVHYPTDVLAGWTLGLVWAVLCWTSARWVERRTGNGSP